MPLTGDTAPSASRRLSDGRKETPTFFALRRATRSAHGRTAPVRAAGLSVVFDGSVGRRGLESSRFLGLTRNCTIPVFFGRSLAERSPFDDRRLELTAHLTARLAWHDDGWNGRVCEQPSCNTFCVGANSFPGDVIARERDIQVEEERAGQAVADLAGAELPPCVYSVNAFGPRAITGYSNPPSFFYGGASRTEWEIPAATVCVWPYEAMYAENVLTEQGFLDSDQRSANAERFFEQVEHDRSLIFYYANYSNPLSDTESPRYVIIGASRVKSVGERLVYQDANEWVRERYAGGAIWARNVSTHYPDEGLRLP